MVVITIGTWTPWIENSFNLTMCNCMRGQIRITTLLFSIPDNTWYVHVPRIAPTRAVTSQWLTILIRALLQTYPAWHATNAYIWYNWLDIVIVRPPFGLWFSWLRFFVVGNAIFAPSLILLQLTLLFTVAFLRQILLTRATQFRHDWWWQMATRQCWVSGWAPNNAETKVAAREVCMVCVLLLHTIFGRLCCCIQGLSIMLSAFGFFRLYQWHG